MSSIIEDIPENDKRYTPPRCQDPSHNPPNMIYIPPGKRLRHKCPTCGQESILYSKTFYC